MKSTDQQFQSNSKQHQGILLITYINFEKQEPTQIFKLRGGGCGSSNQQSYVVDPEKKQQSIIQSQTEIYNQKTQSLQIDQKQKKNIGKQIELKINSIVEKMNYFTSDQNNNEIVLEIQWFIFNRLKLINCCKNDQLVLSSIVQQFENLLDILPRALQTSWFICYQILQICNDLVRIQFIHNQKNVIKFDQQKSILKKLKDLSKELDNVSLLVWKSGLQFEITLLEILFSHSITDSNEGTKLAKDFISKAVESVINFKVSDEFIQSIFSGINYLFQKAVQKLYYPIEVYQVYYLFQIIKFEIIYSIKKEQHTISDYIEKLKDRFEKFIENSDKWILHFCWISLITDLIIYRPGIKRQKFETNWSQLIEYQLVQKISSKQKKGELVLFQKIEQFIFEEDILKILIQKRQNKYKKIVQFLLQGQLKKNFDIWNYYKNFSFQNNNVILERRDYEIVLATDEVKLLYIYIKQFQEKIDVIPFFYLQIFQFQNNRNQSLENMYKMIEFNHIQKVKQQYAKNWAEAIILLKMIREFSLYEIKKIEMLHSCLNQQIDKLQQFYDKIQESKIQTDKFEKLLLDEYISFLTKLYGTETQNLTQNRNKVRDQEDQKRKEVIVDEKIEGFDEITKLYNYLVEYKKLFSLLIDKNSKHHSFQNQNYEEFLTNVISRKWIDQIVEKAAIFAEVNNEDTPEQQFQILDFNITNLRLLQQLLYFQEQRSNSIQKQFSQFQNKSQNQISDEKNNPHLQIIIVLEKILEQLNRIDLGLQNLPKLSVKKDMKHFLQQLKQLIDFFFNKKQQDVANNSQIQNDGIFQNQESSKEKDQNLLKNDSLMEKTINLIKDIQIGIISLRYNSSIKKQNDNSNSEKVKQEEVKQYDLQNSIILRATDQQMINQEVQEDVQNLKIDDKKSIQTLKNQIISLMEEWKNNYSSTQTQTQQNLIKDNNKQEELKENQKVINAIKQVKHFFKSYVEMLLVNISMDQKKLEITKFFNVQIQEIKELQKMILSIKKESKPKSIINMVSFVEFLQFYDTNLEQDNQEKQEDSGFFQSIWSDIKKFYQEIKNRAIDLFEDKDYKVRECLVYNLIKIQQSNLEDYLINFSTKQLQQIWCYEKDQRVRNLLKNKELVQMQKLFFKKDLQTLSDQIKEQIQEKIKSIDQLQQQIRIQGNQKEREKLNLQLNQVYQDLDETLDNISEMSQIMDINLIFLKDIMKNVKAIKAQIDNLQDSVNKLSDDIRKLRGKKYGELLEIRMHKVFDQIEIQEIDSVYVQLITRERILPGRELKPGSKLFVDNVVDPIKDTDGEINEFIWRETNEKDVVLISGFAGSGKSRAVKKIEEFLWKLKQEGASKWIPIFVSLPTLKNPKFNLFEQALESQNYQFDKYQIREFKKAIQEKQEKIILILDSYDEMKADCIQQNLISTNKIIQDLAIDKNDRQVKFIITTRREILTTEGYENWFKGESLKTYKEIQLLNFNQKQQEDYLIQYCELSVKRIIKLQYEFLRFVQNLNFDPREFKSIWKQLYTQVSSQLKYSQQNNQDFIFQDSQNQTSKIIQEIKTIKLFKNLSEEQLVGLKKNLESLWNKNKFKKTIETAKLQSLLTTPFMLEIVVQVLPSMIRNYQGSSLIRDILKSNYKKIVEMEELSKEQIIYFQENKAVIENSGLKQSITNDVQTTNDKKYAKITFHNIDLIIDELESQNFFQKYSLDSNVKRNGNDFSVDSNKFNIQVECIDFVIRALKMQNLTAFEFYENFINYYHEQQISKLRDLGLISNYQSFIQDVHQYSLSLALDMTIRDLSQIEYQEKGKLQLQSDYKIISDADNWLDQYLGSSNSDYEYKKLIKSCTLLSAKGSMHSFTHKSIQEFYVAYFIFNFLTSIDIKNKKEKFLKSIFNQEQFNISSESFMAACNFIIEKLKIDENIQKKLIEIVQLSNKEESIRASSNSIYLLSLLQVHLGEKEFPSIRLSNTSISKLCFVNSNLSYSEFKNVQIDQCNFNNCNLSDIKWEDIKCQEQPAIEINEQFKKIQFTPDGKHIISISRSGKIEIRNSKNFQLLDIDYKKWLKLNKNQDSYLIMGSKNLFISEIKMIEIHKKDYQDCIDFKQSKDQSRFFIQTSEYFRIQNKQQLEKSRDKSLIKENQKQLKIGDDSPYQFSPDCSILVYAQLQNLFFSALDGEPYCKSLKICDSKIQHLEFCKNGSYFICTTVKQLYIFERLDKKDSIDFEEFCINFNVSLSNHKYFLDNYNLYFTEQLKSIGIISIKDNKGEYDLKQFQLEQQEKIQNQNKNSMQENELQEDLNQLINNMQYSIHLILSQENQQQSKQQFQFYILLSTKQQIYFNNPKQKQLCKVNQKQEIKQILIFPNYTLSHIQFILITINDKIIIYKISQKDKDFKKLLDRQLYVEKIDKLNIQSLEKKYTLSNDGKTLFLQNGNHLWWYLITEDQINGIGIFGQNIISINSLANTNVHDLYFSNLDHFLMIIKTQNEIFYKKILFSEILYITNIEIYKDSIISLSEDEQVILINNKSINSVIYFHQKYLHLQTFKNCKIYAAEVIDESTFIQVKQENGLYNIQICKYKEKNSKIQIDDQNFQLLGEQCLFYQHFQKQKVLILQAKNKFLSIINFRNLQTIERIKEKEEIFNVSISPDSLVLLYECNKMIKFWNLNITQKGNQEIHQGHQKEISAIAFSKDGFLIASGSADGSIILWNYKNLQYLTQLSEHQQSINKLFFFIRNTDQILVSCCEQHLVKIWNIHYSYQDRASSYTINFLQQIHSISISVNKISLTYKNYLYQYDYTLEEKYKAIANQSYEIKEKYDQILILDDNYYFQLYNNSLNFVNLRTQQKGQLEKNLSKKCKSVRLSDDNSYLILEEFPSNGKNSLWRFLVFKQDFKQKSWNQIYEFFTNMDTDSFKLSPNNKLIVLKQQEQFVFYDFEIIQKFQSEFGNEFDGQYIYSMTKDFQFAIIFKEGSSTIKLKNRKKKQSDFIEFSYKNPKNEPKKYCLSEPKLSKNQNYIAAFVKSKKMIVVWEVNNPKEQICIPFQARGGNNIYEFSFYDNEDQILQINLNEQDQLIKIFTHNLNEKKYNKKIRQIETQISQNYCVSKMHQYFCILNSSQENCIFEIYGIRKNEFDFKISINHHLDKAFNTCMTFSDDDNVFAIKINQFLYAYKKQENSFELFLKIPTVNENFVFEILRNSSRILIKGEDFIIMIKIDIKKTVIEFHAQQYLFQQLQVLSRYCQFFGSRAFTINDEEKIIVCFNNEKKKSNIQIIDLHENVRMNFLSINEFHFCQNGKYFALLRCDIPPFFNIQIFRVEKSFFDEWIHCSCFQFLDNHTKSILCVNKGIITNYDKTLVLHNFNDANKQIDFEFDISIDYFQIKGEICLIQQTKSNYLCQILKISKEREFILLHYLSNQIGYLENQNYIKFNQLKEFKETQEPELKILDLGFENFYSHPDELLCYIEDIQQPFQIDEIEETHQNQKEKQNSINDQPFQIDEIEETHQNQKEKQNPLHDQPFEIGQIGDYSDLSQNDNAILEDDDLSFQQAEKQIRNQNFEVDLSSNSDDNQQNQSQTFLIHLNDLPKFVYQHNKIIKFQQIFSDIDQTIVIDEENQLYLIKKSSKEEKASSFLIKGQVIQYDNENQFFVKENQNVIRMYKKTSNSSYEKLDQSVEISDLEQSNLFFSYNGNYLLKQRENTLEIINLQNNQVIVKNQNLNEIIGVKIVALFPDGNSFATGQSDGSINLYTFNTKNQNQNQNLIICYKSFAIYQNIQSNGCILNKISKIISQNNKDLTELFRSRGARDKLE